MKGIPMLRLLKWTFAAVVLMPLNAGAYEPVRFEEPCHNITGPAPLRQSIVVVDEGALRTKSNGHSSASDKGWIRAVIDLADARDGVATNNMEAGERLIIVVARADGSELVPLFVGCSPNLSSADSAQRRNADSLVDKFFGRDSAAQAKRQVEAFQARILEALTQVVRQVEADDKSSRPIHMDGLLQALTSGGRLVDLANGMPRILLISDLRFVGAKKLDGHEAARKAGFETALKSNLDLSRAEVYVLNLGDSTNPYLRDFAETALLGSKGLLTGWRTDGLPSLQGAPIAVRYFGGTFDYAGLPVPMQIRLAFDRSGTLVNSWVEVTVSKAVATPFAGKAICQGAQVCEVKGDGKLFAQIWNPNLSAEPRFGEDLPFAGFRYLEMSTTQEDAAGRIYDPKARIRFGSDPNSLTEDFRFTLKVTPGQVF